MAEPRVVQIAKAFRADLLRREAGQVRELTARYADINRALVDKIDALAAKLARMRDAGQEIGVAQLGRLEHWQALQAQLARELADFNRAAGRRILAGQKDYTELGARQAVTMLKTAAGRSALATSFHQLPAAAVEAIAAQLAEGTPLAALLADAYPQVAAQMAQRLANGVALGLNPRVVAAQASGSLGIGLVRALTIARTEELRAYRTASGQTYAANGVSTYKRAATFDDRTCIGCLAADGEEMDSPEIFDAHPNCRCTAIPIVPGAPAPSWTSSESWFGGQDEATQTAIMGPGRLELYNAGEATWSDLWTKTENDTWGGAIVPTLVRDLPGAETAARVKAA